MLSVFSPRTYEHQPHADELLGFARTQGMQVRGHTLMWHRQMPPRSFNEAAAVNEPGAQADAKDLCIADALQDHW